MGLQRLAISNPSLNTDTTLFTATNQYLMSVIATNKSSSNAASIRIWVEPSGSASASDYAYIVYDLTVDQNNAYESFRFAVNQNDVVKVRSNTSDISFQAYGLVQYDVNLGVGVSSYLSASPTNVVDGLIWIDADSNTGTNPRNAYIWSEAESAWIEFVAGVDESANYNFTGTVNIPAYAPDNDQQILAQRMFG